MIVTRDEQGSSTLGGQGVLTFDRQFFPRGERSGGSIFCDEICKTPVFALFKLN